MSRDRDFEGQVFAVTGGASGIGLSTVEILLSRGASVAIGDIDDAALARANDSLKPKDKVLITKVDVSNRIEVDSWIASVVEKFGKLTGAANCAGVIGKHHGTRNVEELEDDQWDLIMRVNLTGTMYCMRAQLRHIDKSSPGSIVCVSSVQGTLGFAGHAAYSASKHGILGLVKSAAKEVGSRNIRVNAVTPGSIQTPLMDKRNALEGVDPNDMHPTPINRLARADEVGKLIAWLLSDEASFVTGATYAVDGGWAC